ncbi:hypothetical protein L210DRAFT_979815 [Boletus edulis BED1]|uniref:Uncharacterized protein n=1 Tax=Boletus edulis BED1 TaxID=1328754 RepID=A0AAD4BHA8_BOLED|nr:hypothetical protein L210DRAFT_979815 [Boletus edulis BED1]
MGEEESFPTPALCQNSRRASVATWAVRVRCEAKYRWRGPLHYINAVDDHPSAFTAVLQEFEGLGARSDILSDADTDNDLRCYVQDATF